jgi:hypothetical protein
VLQGCWHGEVDGRHNKSDKEQCAGRTASGTVAEESTV